MTNKTLQTIRERRSIRSYKDEQIKDEELKAILEAGMYAPNAGGEAWHFTVVQNKDLLKKLNNAAKEAARGMEMAHLNALGNDEDFDCLYGAPTLIIVSGNSEFPIPLDADCAAATQNLLLAAQSLGIGSCWIYFILMAFYSGQGDELKAALKMPEGYKPYYAAVFGYKNEIITEVPERKQNLVTIVR